MSDKEKEELAKSAIEKIRREDADYHAYLRLLRNFRYAHFAVGTIGLVVFSQAMSFGRWNEHTSIENNFNDHATLLACCGLGFMFIAGAAFALHNRLDRLETSLRHREK